METCRVMLEQMRDLYRRWCRVGRPPQHCVAGGDIDVQLPPRLEGLTGGRMHAPPKPGTLRQLQTEHIVCWMIELGLRAVSTFYDAGSYPDDGQRWTFAQGKKRSRLINHKQLDALFYSSGLSGDTWVQDPPFIRSDHWAVVGEAKRQVGKWSKPRTVEGIKGWQPANRQAMEGYQKLTDELLGTKWLFLEAAVEDGFFDHAQGQVLRAALEVPHSTSASRRREGRERGEREKELDGLTRLLPTGCVLSPEQLGARRAGRREQRKLRVERRRRVGKQQLGELGLAVRGQSGGRRGLGGGREAHLGPRGVECRLGEVAGGDFSGHRERVSRAVAEG